MNTQNNIPEIGIELKQELNNDLEKETFEEEKKDRTVETENIRSSFRILLAGFTTMILAVLLCAVGFSMMMNRVRSVEVKNFEKYDKHVAFITDNSEREFWDEVFEGAKAQAETTGIYVERLGDSLAVDYSNQDLLRMAINSSVDGIIFSGDENTETIDLINRAVEEGIFVITLRSDIDSSERQCFVGINMYDLGQEYGKLIAEGFDGKKIPEKKICLLIGDTLTDPLQTVLILGVQDAISAALPTLDTMPEFEIRKIDSQDTFAAEEAIRDLFIDENNLPDVMVCLNSTFTQCTYQAAVDYNRVGDVLILGYYASSSILDAVEKSIIYSTIHVDTANMGKTCVDVLQDYLESGYANSYVPIATKVIGKDQVKEYREEADSVETTGN